MFRGGKEQKIRKELVDNNLIERILEAPKNDFVDTGISTTIIVFNKNKKNTDIEFVDEKGNAKIINKEEIIENDYNLAINMYRDIPIKKVEYEKPMIILDKVIEMEEEIQKTLKELRGNLWSLKKQL